MKGLIIFITEAKLYLKNKKEDLLEKWDDVTFNIGLVGSSIKEMYNMYCKDKVDAVKTYFSNLYKDFDDSTDFLYDRIWYRTVNRVLGYILSAVFSLLLFLFLGIACMAGLPMPFFFLTFVPISLIPIDIVVTLSLFINNRFKRAYKNSVKRMKKEYGVYNDKDLVEAYKAKKEQLVTKKPKVTKTTTRKAEPKSVIDVETVPEMTDSDFLQKMFGYVSCSKYVSENDREKFLDEINFILGKYSSLKKNNNGIQVNGYLQSDVEHLQNEYRRYVSNQDKKTNNDDGYSMGLRK